MAELDPNDLWQDRGVIKVTDGVTLVEVTENSELKVSDDQTDTTSTSGGQKQVNVVDVDSNQVLGDILKELKKMNLHLSLLTDISMTNSEV